MSTTFTTPYTVHCHISKCGEFLHVDVVVGDTLVWGRTRYVYEWSQMRDCVRRNWGGVDVECKALSQLEQLEARWRNQAIERVPVIDVRKMPRAVPLVCLGLFGLLFWYAAWMQLAEWFWEVVR